MYLDAYSPHIELHRLHPDGLPLTEDHMLERKRKQRELAIKRIEELMTKEDINTFAALTQAKMAHRGLDCEPLFDEALEAVKKAHKMSDVQAAGVSAQVASEESRRRLRIEQLAAESAHRAGIETDPRFRDKFNQVPPVPVSPATALAALSAPDTQGKEG